VTTAAHHHEPGLIRGIGLGSATALNMIDMIGVGPFITMPLMVGAMGGPQAMLGWMVGAVLALADGLVWAELGAAMPLSGGSYAYLQQIYGPRGAGRLFAFLFIWQLSFSAPLSIASGCIGVARYAEYIFPALGRVWMARPFRVLLPPLGRLELNLVATSGTAVAVLTCLLAMFLLHRRITAVGWLSKFLWVGVMGAIVWVIAGGVTHFDAARAFAFPPNAFAPRRGFFTGLGAAMLIATYDYWGYYNICFLGGEVKDPGRTIPRAVVYSILAVAALYLVMNISLLGVLPWRELEAAARTDRGVYAFSLFMERIYGHWAGVLVAGLIMWTAFASVFSLLLGYSRVPYAAALDGNYFRVFADVHPRHRFPRVSLLALGAMACLFCFLRLADVIAALVVIRLVMQFLLQAVGVMVLRARRPEMPRPFRMWLYPAPALLAIAGFLYILFSRQNFVRELRYAEVILVVGTIIYIGRAWRRQEWPFLSGDRVSG